MASVLRGSDNFDSAGINALRAWVNFNGAGTVINGAGNVASITDVAAGSWDVNFAEVMSDALYAAVYTSHFTAAAGACFDQVYSGVGKTVSKVHVEHYQNGAAADSYENNVAVFR